MIQMNIILVLSIYEHVDVFLPIYRYIISDELLGIPHPDFFSVNLVFPGENFKGTHNFLEKFIEFKYVEGMTKILI